jgi:hypothetical protein
MTIASQQLAQRRPGGTLLSLAQQLLLFELYP